MTAIKVKDVSKVFGTRKALDDLSFELPEGAFLSIFGPNGAGKTTLLRVLATLARPSSGAVNIVGIDALESPDEAREHIGLVSHAPMLYSDLSAEENLLLYAQLYGVADPQKRVLELLDAVGLAHRRLDAVRTFSRGMTQRVAIARALVHNPQIVLLDEPYSGLDPHAVEIFDTLLSQIRTDPTSDQQRTFVMVSHDLQKGLQLCTHALVLAKGQLVAFDTRENLNENDFAALYRETVGMGVA